MTNLSSEKSSLTTDKDIKENEVLDSTLRPQKWDDFIGQKRIKKNIKIIIDAAKKRKEPCFEHLLFYGNSGLGKTTLSYLIAKELDTNLKVIAGPSIERAGDLAAVLTNLSEGDVLFIDECHRIKSNIEEFLYPAMEEYKLNIILGRGPMAKTMELQLPRFTLIGATTKVASLSAPLRNRFGATFQLDFYGEEEVEEIIKRSANVLNVKIEPEAIKILSHCSRRTPRVANRLLKRVRDWAQVEGKGIIDEKITKTALRFLEIDELGLEPSDRKILKIIIEKFQGGPVGLQAISAAGAEDQDTILDIYEPYLMRLGFIERTRQGRVATQAAYRHLNIKYNGKQKRLI